MKDARGTAAARAGEAAPRGAARAGGGPVIPGCCNVARHFLPYTPYQINNTGHLTHEG